MTRHIDNQVECRDLVVVYKGTMYASCDSVQILQTTYLEYTNVLISVVKEKDL